MLQKAAEHGFHFDTVQMPLNVMDAHFRSFAHLVLPELVKQQIGVLGMKSMGSGVILTRSTPVYDVARGAVYSASDDQPLVIPEDAVVVAGSRAISQGKGKEWGVSLYDAVNQWHIRFVLENGTVRYRNRDVKLGEGMSRIGTVRSGERAGGGTSRKAAASNSAARWRRNSRNSA